MFCALVGAVNKLSHPGFVLAKITLLLLLAQPLRAGYEYYKVDQTYTDDMLIDVAWHPGGDYALVVEYGGLVLKVKASDWSVASVGSLGSHSLWAVDFNPDGSEALVVGKYGSEGRVYRWDHQMSSLTLLTACSKPGKELRGVDFRADGSGAVVTGYSSNILTVYEYDPTTQLLQAKQAINADDPTDVSYHPDGQTALITIDILNVYEYRPYAHSNILRDTGLSGGSGNVRCVDHHPVEGYAFVGSGGTRLNKYDGAWSHVYVLPISTSFYVQKVAFNSNGSRALIVGRARSDGSGGTKASVIEFVENGGAFTSDEFSEVSITGFHASPWFGDHNTYFHSVAFRPNKCEGLMVGNHGTGNPHDSPIARFVDFRGADCLPVPDAGTPDSYVPDTNLPDTNLPDTILPDTNVPDASSPDTAVPDIAAPDSHGPDSYKPDSYKSPDSSSPDAFYPDLWTHPDVWVPVDSSVADANLPDRVTFDLGLTDTQHPDGYKTDGATVRPDAGLITCFGDNNCPTGYYCDQYTCTYDCVNSEECPGSLICDHRGRCQDPNDAGIADSGVLPDSVLPDGVLLADSTAGDACTSATGCAPCQTSQECPRDYYCNGYCMPCEGDSCLIACDADTECAAGYYCNGYCVPVCYNDSDCPHDLVCGKWGRCAEEQPVAPESQGCQCGATGNSRSPLWLMTVVLVWMGYRRTARRTGV